jgi:hypothetical protein
MATFYNRVVKNVNTAEITALTSTTDSTIILSILAANTNGVSATDVTLRRLFGATDEGYLAYTITVPADASVDLLANKYILPSGRKLNVSSNISGTLDLQVSYVEI